MTRRTLWVALVATLWAASPVEASPARGRVKQRSAQSGKSNQAQKNATLRPSSRIRTAESTLGRNLRPSERTALLRAHDVGHGEVGADGKRTAGITEAGRSNFTREQLSRKVRILSDAGFSQAERRGLLEVGLAGRSTQILPAHMTTGDFKARSRGRQVHEKYKEFVRRHGSGKGTDQAWEGLHPFVQANYGDKVPIIGVSANTKTGTRTSTSFGATVDEGLSAFLSGRGPMPKEIRAQLDKSQPRAKTELVRVSKTMRPEQRFSNMTRIADAMLHSGRTNYIAERRVVRNIARFAERLPGDVVVKSIPGGGFVLEKSAPTRGRVEITYIPGDGLAMRAENYQTMTGEVIAASKTGSDASGVIVNRARLIVQKEDPNQRFVPEHVIERKVEVSSPYRRDVLGF